MAMSNEDLLKELSAKPIMEVVELVKMLEDEWGRIGSCSGSCCCRPCSWRRRW